MTSHGLYPMNSKEFQPVLCTNSIDLEPIALKYYGFLRLQTGTEKINQTDKQNLSNLINLVQNLYGRDHVVLFYPLPDHIYVIESNSLFPVLIHTRHMPGIHIAYVCTKTLVTEIIWTVTQASWACVHMLRANGFNGMCAVTCDCVKISQIGPRYGTLIAIYIWQ